MLKTNLQASFQAEIERLDSKLAILAQSNVTQVISLAEIERERDQLMVGSGVRVDGGQRFRLSSIKS